MRIDASFANTTSGLAPSSTTSASSPRFADSLRQAVQAASSQSTNTQVETETGKKSLTAQQKAEAARAAHQAVVKDLQDYLNKSPAEHLRESVLKELGLTEEDLKAMPPEKRNAMEAKINQRIKERLAGKKDGPQDDPVGLQRADLSPAQKEALAAQANAPRWTDPIIAALRQTLG